MQIPQTMVYYHVHSMLSNGTTNVDSITNFRDYVKAAKECGMPALGFSEHGNIFEWLHKKEAIEAAGMKYIHGIEAYLTEDGEDCAFYTATDLINTEMANAASGKSSIKMQFKFRKHWQSEDGKWLAIAEEHPMPEMVGKTLWYDPDDVQKSYDKTKDNYHCILIAKNYEGVKELNRLVSRSFCRDDFHFYYMPRISFDELFATSDNIIVTTACLGGVLHKGSPVIRERFMGFLRMNKHRCFLEIQHHNCADQIEYNRFLYELSQSIDVPLIAGTDTHAMNATHMEGRAVLQRAKGVHFGGEDEWDLTFKTVGELIAAYKRQKSLPMDAVYQAINNTVVMADMVEPFKLDYSPKYPKLYADSEGEFKRKINAGVIWRGVNKLPNYKTYLDRIHYEYDTYKHNNAIDFMLLEEDYKSEMRRRGVKFGYSRGSVSGSEIAYLLGITEIDSVKYDLNFERFMNKERVSLADIDTDWLSEDREIVKQYLYGKKGLYCCDIVTFNTIALKGSIRDVCRGFFNENMDNLSDEVKAKIKAHRENIKGHDSRDMDVSYSKELQAEITADYLRNAVHREVPYDYIAFGNQLANMIDDDEAGARKKYPAIFRLVDMVNGCVVSVGNHPAGCVVSPVPVDEWFGTFTSATDDYPISVLNMKEIDSLNFVKLDILGLDNIGLIYKTCELAGIPFLTPDNTPADDEAVWNSIREDTTMIFQWESKSATAYLKQLFSDATVARIREKNPNFSYMNLLSVGNGAIRPAGESYRDSLAQGEYRDNGNDTLNEFLSPTLGYLVYQEQIIEFLHKFCGFTMGEADIVRRHFSKKVGTETDIPIIKDGGYLSKDKKHYIEGFISTMEKDYGVPKEEAEQIIVGFLKVIVDASDYLFSKNHADPYSWIGYICGYLRYYYPLEFITTALNIFEDKEDKSLAIIDYAKKQGIRISPIKFRHSVANYNFDKQTNEIFKGISSIKYMNKVVADDMYALRDNHYPTFMHLLFDLSEKTRLNSRQLQILIELDFFSEFGDINYLLEQYRLFTKFNGKVQFRKANLAAMGFTEEQVRPFAISESEKIFKVDMRSMLLNIGGNVTYKPITLAERVMLQIEHLGYINLIGEQYSGMAVVLEVDTKYSPKVKMYSLKNGTTLDCKISKQVFNKCKLEKGELVKILGQNRKAKQRKNEDGEWVTVPGVFDIWITKYQKVSNL